MSELMDRAVITMPYELAMSSELSRWQFYQRAQDVFAQVATLQQEKAELSDLVLAGDALIKSQKRTIKHLETMLPNYQGGE